MNTNSKPLVSVVTPVYNCGPYLAECIESVLRQTYQNFEYLIVNNCSTDATQSIAERYAQLDKRIRLHNNEKFLDIIANHNNAFQLISPESKYCKVVSGDDWVFPECLERMVALADSNPSVGIVGSYQLSGSGPNWRAWRVRWTEVPYPSPVVPGRVICRSHLLGGPYVFGNPTTLLYRADLIRATDAFYPNSTAEADTSACYKHLQNSDFGFVHQVLSYERIHESQISTVSKHFNRYKSSHLRDILEYGPLCLSKQELCDRVKEVVGDYYRFLALSAFERRGKEFWAYHKARLRELGYPVSGAKIAGAVLARWLYLTLNPKQTGRRVINRLKG